MQATFIVENISRFEEKLQALQRKAKKHNLVIPTVIYHTEENVIKWVNDWKYIVTEHTLTVEFDNLSVDDCQLIARIDHKENVINTVPGQTLPKEYLRSEPKCDHCQQNRQRNDTFIVQMSDGTYKQVGRQCLGLYLEIDVAACLYVADLATEMSSLEDDEYKAGGYSEFHYALDYVLSLTCHVLREDGYTSRKTALETGKTATSTLVRDLYLDNMQGKVKTNVTPYTDEVKSVLAYMLTLGNSQQEYELNLYNIALNDYCTHKTLGFAVSSVNAYNKHIAKAIEAQNKQTVDLGFYGTINHKFTPKAPLHVKVIRLSEPKSYESSFGTVVKQWYTMQDNAGYIFTWHSTAYKLHVDQDVTLTGTIIEHSLYKTPTQTISQTVLKNCRIK